MPFPCSTTVVRDELLLVPLARIYQDDEMLGCQSWSFLYRVVSIHILFRTIMWSSRHHMALQFYHENAVLRTTNLFSKRSLDWIFFIMVFNNRMGIVLIAEVGFYREILFSIWKFGKGS